MLPDVLFLRTIGVNRLRHVNLRRYVNLRPRIPTLAIGCLPTSANCHCCGCCCCAILMSGFLMMNGCMTNGRSFCYRCLYLRLLVAALQCGRYVLFLCCYSRGRHSVFFLFFVRC